MILSDLIDKTAVTGSSTSLIGVAVYFNTDFSTIVCRGGLIGITGYMNDYFLFELMLKDPAKFFCFLNFFSKDDAISPEAVSKPKDDSPLRTQFSLFLLALVGREKDSIF